MIERVLQMVGINDVLNCTKMHGMPAISTTLLDNNPNDKPRIRNWNYRSVVGALSYLQAMVRSDITFTVEQCARFCNNPRQQHEDAVKLICCYLLRTKEKGLVLRPDKSRGLEYFVDADWAGYVIMYAGFPIIWASKMQTLVSLSTIKE